MEDERKEIVGDIDHLFRMLGLATSVLMMSGLEKSLAKMDRV